MNDSGSKPEGAEDGQEPFVESDKNATTMAYDSGGVPMYVAIIWVLFLASYVAYMVKYGLPDLSAWGGP